MRSASQPRSSARDSSELSPPLLAAPELPSEGGSQPLSQPLSTQDSDPASRIPHPASAPSAPKLRAPHAPRSTYFLPYQSAWVHDPSHLKICQKSRQVGLSYADSYDAVRKAAVKTGRDVWVMSRDEIQARQYVLYCKRWAKVLRYAAEDHGEQVFTTDSGKAIKVQVLTFASGASIYALSSNPDAIVGKTGHVKLDEFALHKDQRTLFAVAKPVTQWGGTLSIISTHRGANTVFNQLIRDIGAPPQPLSQPLSIQDFKSQISNFKFAAPGSNPMGWSLHTIPIQLAVQQGIVEKINRASRRHATRETWLARLRAECIDEEQWLQEYCCVPADESTAFISYEMITACEDPSLVVPSTLSPTLSPTLSQSPNPLFLGVDVARKTDLCVLDLGEKKGDVMWDVLRIELRNRKFAEIRSTLESLLSLPSLRRCCIDATGLGMQLAEEAKDKFGWRVEPITFTAPVKEELAFPLRAAFEDKRLRIPRDESLRADLRGIKKETTAAGNIRFVGESEDSHCDRFWAKALRQHAAATVTQTFGAGVG